MSDERPGKARYHDGLGALELATATGLLQAAGYHEVSRDWPATRGRTYRVEYDGFGYSIDYTEHDDAPVRDAIQKALAATRIRPR